MQIERFAISRRRLIAALGAAVTAAALAGPARAAGLLGSLNGLLGQASDSALDKLAQPGAFYADPAVRIALPLVGGSTGVVGQVLGGASKLGLTDGLVRKLNDAAGLAAREAKPIFRAAIDRLQLSDVPGIVKDDTGATQYLHRSAGDELKGKLRPLVDAGLKQVGAFTALDKLSRKSSLTQLAGISHDKLGNSVTEQALSGIFKYIGGEEQKLRADPLKPAGSLLQGLFKKGS
ncbi:DUF4197 domain-containing protein [Novosphingobium sp.]|uniref:DUF4197 domain-containing protein n=1 Tax=Novosphingobium sp. TaxID=1874826 RepID=UPI0035AFBCD0